MSDWILHLAGIMSIPTDENVRKPEWDLLALCHLLVAKCPSQSTAAVADQLWLLPTFKSKTGAFQTQE